MKTIVTKKEYDEGLRYFMINMYNHTAFGLLISGLVAYYIYKFGLISTFMSGILGWIFIFAPLVMILFYSFMGQNWNVKTITYFYYTFVTLLGISLSVVFTLYTTLSIAQVFFIAAATFASASIYGYTTKKDLTSMSNFLFTGLIGIIIALIVNIFLQLPAVMFAISVIGVIVFIGLIAYDTQNAKNIYFSVRDSADSAKYGIVFALNLYLNFINLFQMLLNLIGELKENE
jgi:FtsH-binding integral membrane protein